MVKKADETKPKLSEMFFELEKLTGEFEHGEVDLEQGIAKYKWGLALAKELKVRLAEMENQIEELKTEFAEAGNGGGEEER